MSKAKAAIYLSGLLAVLVMWLPLAHSIIPHSHGALEHDHHSHTHTHTIQDSPLHTEGENVAWSSMHGALSHEDKKILLAVFALFAMWALIFSFVPPVSKIFYLHKVSFTLRKRRWNHAFDINRGNWLIRGVSASRRFV